MGCFTVSVQLAYTVYFSEATVEVAMYTNGKRLSTFCDVKNVPA